ncbi:MAG TPA: YobA family protein [Candidatus Blautia merdigallinarum]|uniref:YobA family protein n=1 Tax=Candidatus Blautia merdigallinarum TaxID=2838495 RepID=A0A9D2N7A5_9FIRM|nr:YobA family protein [Candidatus Blautia merdigallinarum]
MRNNNTSPIVYIGVLLVTLVILTAANMLRSQFSSEEPQEENQVQGEYALKAVYLEKEDGNSIFVNLTEEYPFDGNIPEGELYDEDGEKITQEDLNSGDVLNIWGNGVIAESYPAQYNGITKMERTEQSNQEYIDQYGHYLEELFVEKDPSELPYLNVCYRDELADAAVMIPDPLSYTWTYTDESGESRTVTTDGAHVLHTEPVEVKKISEPMTMELYFDEVPESVELLVWDDTLLGQYQDSADQIPEGTAVEVTKNGKGNLEFNAQPGSVYLVQGQWEQGTAEYGFWVPSE